MAGASNKFADNGTLEDSFTLEEHIILRLPIVELHYLSIMSKIIYLNFQEEANELRAILRDKPDKLKKLLKLDMDPNTNKVTVYLSNKVLIGTVKKLPTVIESYKTNICNNKSVLFKTADVSHLVECSFEDNSNNKTELNHGYCPPLKNVKRKRFRKAMFNQDFAIEAETISKELYYLLSTDLEAVRYKKFH